MESRTDRHELTDHQKKVIAVALVLHLILVTLTRRDLRHRPGTVSAARRASGVSPPR